ncbi:dolichyldiphosphatase [Acrasis kona]|uniref:Dolichyldiphosphatase n=1 Tax=Acrasis kona TaxID=1008807 RepID=A0AAW2YN18_9EUKA
MSNGGETVVKSFDLTFVLYEQGNILSFLFGTAALSPIIIGTMLCTLIVFNRDIEVAFVGLGIVINEVLNQILKKTFKQARPDSKLQRSFAKSLGVVGGDPTFGDGSTHSKYGMPSAHTQFMMFFAVCIPLILRSKHVLTRSLAIFVAWFTAIFVAYSRIHMDHHTEAQVLVGAFTGISFGIFWKVVVMRNVQRYVVPFVRRTPLLSKTLEIASVHDK